MAKNRSGLTEFDPFIYRRALDYPYQTMSEGKLNRLIEVAKRKKLKRIDLTQTSFKEQLLPYIYELRHLPQRPKVEIPEALELIYQRLSNGGYFEKRRDAKNYMRDMLLTARLSSNDWLIWEDLRDTKGLKHIIEIMDYGPFLQEDYDFMTQGKIRYRKLKTSLTQPIYLYRYIQENPKHSVWEMGTWGWEDIIQDWFGLHLPSTPEEDVIVQILKGILNDEVIFIEE